MLADFIKPTSKILNIGCGNALFSEDLYDDGFPNQLNIDISSVVIAQMRERNIQSRPEMQWEIMDCCDMKGVESNSVDIVIDKSTMDALLCGDNSFVNVAKMIKETQRILKPNGVYFVISYGKPDARLLHFQHAFCSFDIREFIVYDSDAVTA